MATTASTRVMKVETFAAAVVGQMTGGDNKGTGLVNGEDVLLESIKRPQGGGIRGIDATSGVERIQLTDQPRRTMSGVAVSVRPGRPGIVWQLTLKDKVAIARDQSTLAEQRQVPYRGEGWGLCDDGTQLVQSEGTMRLVLRDADTFAEKGVIEVAGGWWSSRRLGELECVRDGERRQVWANLADTSWLLRVDLEAGAVTAVADLAPAMAGSTAADRNVVSGIASVPGVPNELWLSGSGWPRPVKIRLAARP
uniref:glutaminyl-peptide cyclotransferase n=1 Tax=Lentzea alba TaxID=2714351 RepID=UPI0039BFA574